MVIALRYLKAWRDDVSNNRKHDSAANAAVDKRDRDGTGNINSRKPDDPPRNDDDDDATPHATMTAMDPCAAVAFVCVL